MNGRMWDKGLFPSFEEGTLRPLNKCLATLNGAQRGRSEPCCNSGLTSPAAPNLKVALQLLDRRGHPCSKEGIRRLLKILSFIHRFYDRPCKLVHRRACTLRCFTDL